MRLPGGELMLLDCGRNSGTGWSPSVAYWGQAVDLLAFQNFDEDHVRDLPHLLERCSVQRLFGNPTVNAEGLKWMKDRRDGMGLGIETAHSLLSRYGAGLCGGLLQESEASVICFWNRFSKQPTFTRDFADENNLSVPILIRWRGFSILFCGDMTDAGWQPILQFPLLYNLLTSVDILVAGHHGRDDGRSEKLLSRHLPRATVISDGRMQYGTQEGVVDWYRRRTLGVERPGRFIGDPPERRKVFTTRRDGCITIDVNHQGEFEISLTRASSALINSAA
ncbi:MAG: hypothetical protein AAGF48_13615 [Pseudomonadota bacterium]